MHWRWMFFWLEAVEGDDGDDIGLEEEAANCSKHSPVVEVARGT